MENTIELFTEPDGSIICLHNDQVLFFFDDEEEADLVTKELHVAAAAC